MRVQRPKQAPRGAGGSQVIRPVPCIFDVNGDGAVNGVDLGTLALAFTKRKGEPGCKSAADFNADGFINGIDLGGLAANFLGQSDGCAPGYPYYNPGPSWTGALPNGYN